VSFLAGYATTSYGGRIRAVQLRGGEGPLRAIITADEIRWTAVTPGFRVRRPVIFAEYKTFDNPDAPDEVRAFHQPAIDNLGQGRIQTVDRLPEAAMSYVQAKTAAEAIAAREIAAFGLGLLQWSFEHIYSRPDLTLGDRVAVECDRFVARDPNAARALKGAVWAVGRIVGIHDHAHTRFSIHLENWADIIASTAVVTRTNLNELARCIAYHSTNQNFGGTEDVIQFDSETEDIGGFHNAVGGVLSSRQTVPSGWGGGFEVEAYLPYTTLDTTGTVGSEFVDIILTKNGITGELLAVQRLDGRVDPLSGLVSFFVPHILLAAGDYVNCYYTATGLGCGMTVVGNGAKNAHLSIRRINPARGRAGVTRVYENDSLRRA